MDNDILSVNIRYEEPCFKAKIRAFEKNRIHRLYYECLIFSNRIYWL